MAVEVTPLRLSRKWHAEQKAKRKWMKIWEDLGKRILKMPEWMQDIILEDVNTAVRNRIATMEMIHNAKRRT